VKKFEDALKALEAVEGGAEFVEAVNAKLKADVEAEKNKGIAEKKKVDAEAKGLRERLKKVTEPLGLDPEAEDFDTNITSLKELKEKGVQKPNVKTDPEFVALNKELSALKAKDAEREKREQAQRDKVVRSAKKAALVKAMTEKKVVPDAMDELMLALDGNLHVDDDDKVTWKGDAEGEFITVEDGLGKFLEKKAFYVENSQSPGGGSGPSNKGGTGTPSKAPTVNERRDKLNELTRTAL
jgi:hypothetical protein